MDGLEWDEVVKLNIIPYVMFGLLALATIGDKQLKDRFTKKQSLLIILIILAITGLIFTSIYLQWTKSEVEINGVQGRYFIPILPLIFFLLGKIKIHTTYEDKQITKFITIVGYITIICTAITIMALHI